MSQYLIQGSTLTKIADAIRVKTGKNSGISASEMANEISSIETGIKLPTLTNEAFSEDLLSGKQLINSYGDIVTGIMPNNSNINKIIDNVDEPEYQIPVGYHNGLGKVAVRTCEVTIDPSKNKDGGEYVPSDLEESGFNYFIDKIHVLPFPKEYQDVSSVTAIAGEVGEGKTFVDSTGTKITGTFTLANELSKQDELIIQIQNALKNIHFITQEKTVIPTEERQIITADEGYHSLSQVIVEPIEINSGGTDLNFSIVRYDPGVTLPDFAEENTLAAFTEQEITSWVFAPEKPIEPETGMVWIYAGTFSTRGFNALKENALYTYPIYANQYDGSMWKSIDIKIYQNGWQDFELVMYKDGAFNTDIFGKVTHNGMVQTDGSILLYRYGELNHDNFVDITPYSTFQYDIVVSNYGRVEAYIKNQANITIASTGQKQGVQTITLDVSDINEPIKVSFYVYGNSNNDNTYINNLKFLP